MQPSVCTAELYKPRWIRFLTLRWELRNWGLSQLRGVRRLGSDGYCNPNTWSHGMVSMAWDLYYWFYYILFVVAQLVFPVIPESFPLFHIWYSAYFSPSHNHFQCVVEHGGRYHLIHTKNISNMHRTDRNATPKRHHSDIQKHTSQATSANVPLGFDKSSDAFALLV